jgi:hypothetical protein
LRETRSLSLPVLTCRAEYFLFFFILFFSGKKSETTEREEEVEPEGCGMRNEIHHSATLPQAGEFPGSEIGG